MILVIRALPLALALLSHFQDRAFQTLQALAVLYQNLFILSLVNYLPTIDELWIKLETRLLYKVNITGEFAIF